ncbi:hypothetical protein HWQ46_25925 [Shewanella sp. D64]|uniref:transposase n=1 Tax=unclassified Shewanella TaxID=196818 RepID=UPI0022BA5A0A|nr:MULTISPECIES: transposase [unclassified Shewanella]MEC4728956.1 hypothetical protein [Shewanella sp. D64]MEC4740813.1 hypothetical protein [Shewanella sp. E94]WBJ96695.1 hypothetical protein HWQ47_06145 [Shewanella sp. MTB7]
MAKQKRFGTSSEKRDYQGEVFNEAETIIAEEDTEAETDSHQRLEPNKQPKRTLLSQALPRDVIIHDISDEEKQWHCGHKLTLMGQDSSEKLEFVPAHIKV